MLKNKLKNQFGYNDYKNYLQKEATEAVYKGTKNVYIYMPSGFGKSLCFQLPVVAKDNSFAIVISPTIAYTKNQVDFLKSKNIVVYYWNAYTPKHIRFLIKKNLESSRPKMKLLYITPEQYISSYFQLKLKHIKPNVLLYVVVDEVHCLSPWSHDFRYLYRTLFEWPQENPGVPIIALTATAEKKVREDIFKTLRVNDPLIFSMPVSRSNLFYDVWFIDTLADPLNHLKTFIKKNLKANKALIEKEKRNCGIIFCDKRDILASLASLLNSKGIPTVFYDTRCNIKNRSQVQNLWNSGEVNVIVTTNSFGIGIDKQTVRFIVHWDNIPNIENYYQETGRAGHDDKISYCRIYCYLHKLFYLNKNLDNQKLFTCEYQNQEIYLQTKMFSCKKMIRNILNMKCRHAIISKYFGDPISVCKNLCDVCKGKFAIKKGISQLNYFYQFNSNFNESFKCLNLDKYENLIVTSTNPQKLNPINYIPEIQASKNLECADRQSKPFIYNRSKVEEQLNIINNILYTKQIKEISTLSSMPAETSNVISNVCDTVVLSDKSSFKTNNSKIVENLGEFKIEQSHNQMSVERQLEEINKIIYL